MLILAIIIRVVGCIAGIGAIIVAAFMLLTGEGSQAGILVLYGLGIGFGTQLVSGLIIKATAGPVY